jgi:hypothetical protein
VYKFKHIIERFNERFKVGDFTCSSHAFGDTDFTKDIVAMIADAPNKGKFIKEGNKGNRSIYQVEVMQTKPVFVVWDNDYSVPITVWAK